MVYSNNLRVAVWANGALVGPCGGTGLIEHDPRAMRYLRDVLPAEWNRAASAAALLAGRARYLPWQDRARAFDEFYLGRGPAAPRHRRHHRHRQSAVGQARGAGPGRRPMARFCGAVTAATLLQLDERERVADEAAALIHFFSRSERTAKPRRTGSAPGIIWAWPPPASWPGCAFLLLILSPSDSAESFLARDAFWAAMLGRELRPVTQARPCPRRDASGAQGAKPRR